MRIDILTIFPDIFEVPFSTSIFQRAVANGLVEVKIHNIRDYSHDRHHSVDDYPYGGGVGMVLKPEPIFEAVAEIKQDVATPDEIPVILLTPQGRPFSQAVACELSQNRHLIIICGHYEGVDERVHQYLATDKVSIGDYVLSGGEPAALVVVDAVIRLLPGVLSSEESIKEDSHSDGLLEYPQYTRPAEYRGWSVPEVLLSGNHARIGKWRRQQSIIRTLKRRPELLDKVQLNAEESQFIKNLKKNLINNGDNALLS